MSGHVYVVGFLPGQGDHVGRDKFAVDLISDQRNVYAAAAGTVAFSGQNCDTNPPGRHPCYGGVVVIEHDSGYYSIYTHLDPASLPVQGSHIEAGLAGKVGVMSDSGCRDANGISHCVAPPNADPEHGGDHLHFAIHQGKPGLRGTDALWLSNTPVNIWALIPSLPSSPARGPISGHLLPAGEKPVTPSPTPTRPTASPSPTPTASPTPSPTATPTNAVYSNPFEYCAAVGYEDNHFSGPTSGLYQGSTNGEALVVAQYTKASGKAPVEPTLGVSWRCANNQVWACDQSANELLCSKPDASYEPSQSMKDYCLTNQDGPIPFYVTGHSTEWNWSCQRGTPTIAGNLYSLTEDGYAVGMWYALPPP